MTRRFYKNGDGGTTLTAGINASVTSINVASAGSFPASTPFAVVIEKGTANAEICLVTAVGGSTLTVTRGYNGSTALSHGTGVAIVSGVIALDLDDAAAHVAALSDVHGVTGALVGATQVQTLTNKTLTSPTISGPTVTGTLAGANETLSGTLTVTGTTTVGAVNAGATTTTTLASSGAVTATAAGTGLAVTNNATVGGTLAVTGAATAASYAANGDGSVTGVLTTKSYTNEAARDAAITVPVSGMQVLLTAPTVAPGVPGLFAYFGGVWVQVWGDSGWIVDTLGNSWVSFDGGAAFGVPQHRWRNGVVWFDGEMKSGTTGTAILTLPAGYRPLKQKQFTVQSGNGNATLLLTPGGVLSVQVYNGGSNASVSLNEVTFVAEA